jgi:cation diffusion facilitator family transporter
MSDCCDNASCEIETLSQNQAATLKVVLGINIVMFGVEITAGLLAGSTALLADSLDMLGDALVYGFSLYVVARSEAWKAVSALLKGAIMCGTGLFVLGQALYKTFNPEIPHFETIGLIGLLALSANAICFALLWHHRAEDVNMRSVWLCSRNDIIANISVLIAAVGVWATSTQWPDVLIGIAIALLFLRSAMHVIRDAMHTYNRHYDSETVENREGG